MTLAVILVASVLWASPAAARQEPASAPSQQPASAAEKPADSATQDQTGKPPAPAKPAAAAKTAPAKTATHRKRKKKPSANCTPATTGDSAANAEPAKPCPTPKVIVRQGGTKEPLIQLDGGATGDQAAHQQNTANQMLSAAEMNLKKLAGRQLTANQQDTVKQVRQFVDQSKSAAASGDSERARTLAWKAQLLSEEVVKAGQ